MASEPHPQVQAVLERMDEMGVPDLSTLDPAEARALFEDLRSGEPSESVGDVLDRTIPGPDGRSETDSGDRSEADLNEIPIRVYRPDDEGPHPVLVYFHGVLESFALVS